MSTGLDQVPLAAVKRTASMISPLALPRCQATNALPDWSMPSRGRATSSAGGEIRSGLLHDPVEAVKRAAWTVSLLCGMKS